MTASIADFIQARLAGLETRAAETRELIAQLADDRREIDGLVRNGAEYALRKTGADPGEMEREVAAMRAILAAHGDVMLEREDAPSLVALYESVSRMAAIWSDHPDFDPSWAPETAEAQA